VTGSQGQTTRPAGIQIVFDAAEPVALAHFWAEALGYVDQPAPTGFETWDSFLDAMNVPADQRNTRAALIDPDGVRPRLFFQQVPEGKTAKNRVHLDIDPAPGLAGDDRRRTVRRRAEELVALGATNLGEAHEFGSFWIVLKDPEGNEFCVH
jgi:hypothetical protein